MPSYGRITYRLHEGKSIVQQNFVTNHSALQSFAATLQEYTCAEIVETEFAEIVGRQSVERAGKYNALTFRAMITLREANTGIIFDVPILAPHDSVIQVPFPGYDILRIDKTIGQAVCAAFNAATGKTTTFEDGRLTRFRPSH